MVEVLSRLFEGRRPRRAGAETQGLLCRRALPLAMALAFVALAPKDSRAAQVEASATAGQHHAAVRNVVEIAVRPWLEDAVVLDALRAQNRRSAALTRADIEGLDRTWRRETNAGDQPLIRSVLSTELSHFLRRIRSESRGLLTEIFVMDLRGLNVGQSDVTSDYWQGDEEKWQRSCAAGPEAIFIDEVEEDESTQQFQAQVSLSIADTPSGQVIGCVTIGIDVDLAMDLDA